MKRAAVAAALLRALVAPGAVLAHGGEEGALEKTPARALTQQALALLAQEGKAEEAHERIEAALESGDKARVDVAKLKEVQAAFGRGDHGAAKRLIAAALAGPPRADDAEMADEAAHEDEPKDGVPEGQERRALEHALEFEPERGSTEWIALATGLALVGTAVVVLLAGRRRRARG